MQQVCLQTTILPKLKNTKLEKNYRIICVKNSTFVE